jgi:hypothetical protein
VIVNASGYNYANVAASDGRVMIVGGNAASGGSELTVANSIQILNRTGGARLNLVSDGNVSIFSGAAPAKVTINTVNTTVLGTIECSGITATAQVKGNPVTTTAPFGTGGSGFAPANSGATGTVGDIGWDSSFIYVCTAANTWKRVALSSF